MQSAHAYKSYTSSAFFAFRSQLFVAHVNGEQDFQEVCSSVSLLYDHRGHAQALCYLPWSVARVFSS